MKATISATILVAIACVAGCNRPSEQKRDDQAAGWSDQGDKGGGVNDKAAPSIQGTTRGGSLAGDDQQRANPGDPGAQQRGAAQDQAAPSKQGTTRSGSLAGDEEKPTNTHEH
jgi:hypothetical protein